MYKAPSKVGILLALFIIGAWSVSIVSFMRLDVNLLNPLTYLFILVQMHLYTGLFITAHDAMHATISSHKKLNNFIGQVCTLLYALFPFKKLSTKHNEHHQYVHTKNDPDYHEGSFWSWYFSFIKEYINWWQIGLMAILFNVFKLWVSELNLLLFWVVPSLLSTLQLFYFGTWVPHHGELDNKHQSRTQHKNHVLAFLSCYFFGYHYEHHDSPATPWWLLWRMKN